MTSWNYLSKFVIVGDPSVGKSSLLVRLTDQRFLADPDPTVGVEFGSYIVDIPETGEKIKCQCWDTAGSETFRSITRSYYRGAAGALLVYNITHRPTFEHIADWLRDVREHAEEDVSIILVGNMSDLCAAEDAQDQEASSSQAISAPNDGTHATASSASSTDAPGSSTNTTTHSPSPSTTSSPSRKRRIPQRRQVTRQEAEEFAKRENIMFVETSAKTGKNVEEAFRRAALEIHAKFQASASSRDPVRAGLASAGGASRPGIVSASAGSGGQASNEGRCCIIV